MAENPVTMHLPRLRGLHCPEQGGSFTEIRQLHLIWWRNPSGLYKPLDRRAECVAYTTGYLSLCGGSNRDLGRDVDLAGIIERCRRSPG